MINCHSGELGIPDDEWHKRFDLSKLPEADPREILHDLNEIDKIIEESKKDVLK